jgi:hypothetical protein
MAAMAAVASRRGASALLLRSHVSAAGAVALQRWVGSWATVDPDKMTSDAPARAENIGASPPSNSEFSLSGASRELSDAPSYWTPTTLRRLQLLLPAGLAISASFVGTPGRCERASMFWGFRRRCTTRRCRFNHRERLHQVIDAPPSQRPGRALNTESPARVLRCRAFLPFVQFSPPYCHLRRVNGVPICFHPYRQSFRSSIAAIFVADVAVERRMG